MRPAFADYWFTTFLTLWVLTQLVGLFVPASALPRVWAVACTFLLLAAVGGVWIDHLQQPRSR